MGSRRGDWPWGQKEAIIVEAESAQYLRLLLIWMTEMSHEEDTSRCRGETSNEGVGVEENDAEVMERLKCWRGSCWRTRCRGVASLQWRGSCWRARCRIVCKDASLQNGGECGRREETLDSLRLCIWTSPVYMNFTYLCVWMASGQTELGLMDCIYRESDVELYVEWKGIGWLIVLG